MAAKGDWRQSTGSCVCVALVIPDVFVVIGFPASLAAFINCTRSSS